MNSLVSCTRTGQGVIIQVKCQDPGHDFAVTLCLPALAQRRTPLLRPEPFVELDLDPTWFEDTAALFAHLVALNGGHEGRAAVALTFEALELGYQPPDPIGQAEKQGWFPVS